MLSRVCSKPFAPTLLLPNINIRSFASDKGEERVKSRIDGLLPTKAQREAECKKFFDEDGNWISPPSTFYPSMSRRDIMMNVRIPPLGIVPPPFGDDQIKEITEKTTITRENLEWTRKHWLDTSLKPDEKKLKIIAEDLIEMQRKGVSFGTINLWVDYFSGADVANNKFAIYNRSWARIDN